MFSTFQETVWSHVKPRCFKTFNSLQLAYGDYTTQLLNTSVLDSQHAKNAHEKSNKMLVDSPASLFRSVCGLLATEMTLIAIMQHLINIPGGAKNVPPL